jgi:hypothetical protein
MATLGGDEFKSDPSPIYDATGPDGEPIKIELTGEPPRVDDDGYWVPL